MSTLYELTGELLELMYNLLRSCEKSGTEFRFFLQNS